MIIMFPFHAENVPFEGSNTAFLIKEYINRYIPATLAIAKKPLEELKLFRYITRPSLLEDVLLADFNKNNLETLVNFPLSEKAVSIVVPEDYDFPDIDFALAAMDQFPKVHGRYEVGKFSAGLIQKLAVINALSNDNPGQLFNEPELEKMMAFTERS